MSLETWRQQRSLGVYRYHNSMPFANLDVEPGEWEVTLSAGSRKAVDTYQVVFLYMAEGEFSAPRGVERMASYVRTESLFDIPNALIGPYLRNPNAQRLILRIAFASYVSLLDKFGLDYKDAVSQYFGTTAKAPQTVFPNFLHEGDATWRSLNFPTGDFTAPLYRGRAIYGPYEYEKLNDIHKNLRLRTEFCPSNAMLDEDKVGDPDFWSPVVQPSMEARVTKRAEGHLFDDVSTMSRCCWNVDIW